MRERRGNSGPAMGIETRPAKASDAALIVRYVRALAEFEKDPPDNVLLTEASVLKHAFGEWPRFEVIIAERSGVPAGMALFFETYSTWTATPGIWVEELFVEEEHREHGVGYALMQAVALAALGRGCGRIELATLRWNPATGFYRRLGFAPQEEWQTYRMNGEAITQLASGE